VDVGLFAPLIGPDVGPELVAELGRLAEERGYASVWLGEHVVLVDDYSSTYPYTPDGKMPAVGAEEGLLEPITTLAYLAASTTTLQLGTGVLILPQRNPVVVAKELANVDFLSNGRLRVGVGLGWLREEFAALDAPWDKRADRCRDYVQVMKRLWTDDVAEWDGTFYRLPPARLFPKPTRRPHPPIVFGGESDAALRRVADLGDGWYAFSMLPAQLEPRLRRLDELLAERGRSRADIDIVVCPYQSRVGPDDIDAYAALGVDEVVHMVFARDTDRLRRRFDSLAEHGLAP
jgi:probable F420-dependent oxidoreductase